MGQRRTWAWTDSVFTFTFTHTLSVATDFGGSRPGPTVQDKHYPGTIVLVLGVSLKDERTAPRVGNSFKMVYMCKEHDLRVRIN